MESTNAKVVNLDDYRDTRGVYDEGPQATVIEVTAGGSQRPNSQVSFIEFYPLRDNDASGITDTIAALQNAIQRLDEALSLQKHHDDIGCDDCLQQLVALLPDLFVRGRSIGDGFSAVILATFHSVKNAGGPLTDEQLVALRSGLLKVADAPYIDFDDALDIQERYEGFGLDPDSSEIGKLGEAIVGQG
jgi:hypothetical protein